MLRRCISRLAGGKHPRSKVGYGDAWDGHVKGGVFPQEHRESWPMHTYPKHAQRGTLLLKGVQATRHSISIPFFPPSSAWGVWIFPSHWMTFLLMMVTIDLTMGVHYPWQVDRKPGTSCHAWLGHDSGVPHHFWCYQDGAVVPDRGGAKRYDA